MLKRTPKELLLDQELIGFVKTVGGSEQTGWRASSAKVTVKPVGSIERMMWRASSAKVTKTQPRGNSIEAFRLAKTAEEGES